jgi:hypothetical protein
MFPVYESSERKDGQMKHDVHSAHGIQHPWQKEKRKIRQVLINRAMKGAVRWGRASSSVFCLDTSRMNVNAHRTRMLKLCLVRAHRTTPRGTYTKKKMGFEDST